MSGPNAAFLFAAILIAAVILFVRKPKDDA